MGLYSSLYRPAWYAIYSALFAFFFEWEHLSGVAIGYDYIIGFAVGAIAISLVFFILQGVGLSKMAKANGMRHRWMAFVPFLNLLYVGMISGEVSFFGRRVKRAGLVAMILEIVASIFYVAIALAEVILFVYFYDRLLITTTEAGYPIPQWTALPDDAVFIKNFYMISGYITPILSLVHGVFMLLLYTGLFRKYDPRRSALFAILSVFVPFFAEIATFVLRNRAAIDYEDYVRRRREEQQRRRQQYYGQNPYGNNPYGNNPYGGNPYGQNPYGHSGPYGGNPYGQNPYGQNPYGQNPYGQNPYGQSQQSPGQQPPEDPFAEFGEAGSTQNGGSNGQQSSGGSTKSDDLFD